MNNYLDMLNEDTMEYILDIRANDMEKEIRAVQSKITKLKNKLKPLNLYYSGTHFMDDEEDYEPTFNDYWSISYRYVDYCMEDYLYSNINEKCIVLISVLSEYFSEGDGETFISKKMYNPTYFDILVEASKAIIKTKDYHHRFLEGLNPISHDKLYDYAGIKPKKNINYYEFMLGS